MANRLTILTDFGTRDGYVAAMKGVIGSTAPDVLIDDVAHDVPPGDIMAAAWALRAYWDRYPQDTVHLVVVDPGVGGPRRALAARADGRMFVAPDNGVLSLALAAADQVAVHSIENDSLLPGGRSHTFHGRDVFAPIAGLLLTGLHVSEVGPRIDNPVRLVWSEPLRYESGTRGEVVHIDRFGNLVTNIPGDWVDVAAFVEVEGRVIGPLRRSYVDVPSGELLALVGSAGFVEVSVRDGDAAVLLEIGRGAEVTVTGR